MALVALPAAQVLTPLRFGTATSDRVEVASSALHSSLAANTVLMIVRPTTLTNGRRLFQKEFGARDWAVELSGTTGNVDFYHGYTSGLTQRITNDTPLARLGRWVQIAFVLRGINDMAVYHGPVGAALKESTYGTSTNTATGSVLTASVPFIFGNFAANTGSWQGDIAFGAIVAQGLTLSQANEFFASGILPRGSRFASVFGANGRGRTIDYSGSGLHGTITGAIPRESVVLPWSAGERLYIPAAGGTSYTLTADAGAFTVTGTAANLEYNREVAADAGSFAVTGTDANLEFNREVAAEPGSVSVTGTGANLEYNREVAADAGSVTITGTDATLTYAAGLTLTADPGSFAVTGTDASLERALKLSAETTLYAWTGTDVGLFFGRKVDAAAGSYAVTGTDAGVRAARRLALDVGLYVITGTAADLDYSGAGALPTSDERTLFVQAETRRTTIAAQGRVFEVSEQNRTVEA